MNRQLVAFLSMFSLVLVLSIYYVMLPTSSPTSDAPVIGSVSDANDPYFETIWLEQENNHQQIIETQYEIIASSEYSNAEKAVALEMIAKEEETMKNEKALRDIIIGLGRPSCFVEINDDAVYVLTVSETKSTSEVAEIIFCVQDYLKADLNIQVCFR